MRVTDLEARLQELMQELPEPQRNFINNSAAAVVGSAHSGVAKLVIVAAAMKILKDA